MLLTQSHPNKLYADEVMTVQRVLKTNGYSVSEEDVSQFNLCIACS